MHLRILFSVFLVSGLTAIGYGQGLYVGGSLGNSFQNHNITDLSGSDFGIKDNAFAWKVFGGVGWKFLGLEGGYRDFGEVENATDTGNTVSSRTRGGDLMAKGTLPISFLRFFGKAGFFYQVTDQKLFGSGFDEFEDQIRGSVFAWGVGAGVQLGAIGARLEYEVMEINPDKLSMLSVGVTLGIGDL